MVTYTLLRLIAVAFLVALNAFFVAAEFALVKVRATELHVRVRRGDRKAIVAQQVRCTHGATPAQPS